MVVKEFRGECRGVQLTQRGRNDKHVMFKFLTEDDGNWFVSGQECSSHWMKDLMLQMSLAVCWCEENCTKTEWGYEFK